MAARIYQQSRQNDTRIVQLVIATAGEARLLDGLVEAPDKAEGKRMDSAPDGQPIVARTYSKPVFELCDRQFRLAIAEQRGAERDPSLGIARISFDCLFQEFDTPGRVAQVGKRATGKAKYFGTVAIERQCLVCLGQCFVGFGHVTDQVTDRQQ